MCLKSHFIIGHVFVECSFDPVSSYISSPTASPLTGTRLNPCATPLWDGPSGHLADPTPNTGYEPKFCIDVSSEHTQINLQTRNICFHQEYDATIAASEDLKLPRHSGASSSSQHMASSNVPTLLRIMILLQVGLASRRLVRTWIVKQLFQVFSGLCQKGRERSRQKRCANIEKQADSPQNP